MRISLAWILAMLGGTVSANADTATVWLEAEQFREHGGWVNDAQFVDQMGSPYLLANGIGSPVGDARTTVTVPRPSDYRLWVRTKDWCPEHHPGLFQVLVNGEPTPQIFGQSARMQWRWEEGGVHRLEGNVEICLRDLTGYYGRCDAVVLTTDLHWQPPTEMKAIEELRIHHGALSREVNTMPAHDVVVVGGGLAGCTAAVAAARNGASVALIQNRPVLGGNASTEILVPPVGVWAGVYRAKYPLDPRETGLIEEYRTTGNQRVSEGKLYSKRLLRFVQLEPNLGLYLNTHATGVEMQAGKQKRIAAVLAIDVNTGKRLRFPGTIFIDCTGDAVVGVAAGAEYRHGKEPKSMYNEPWAPESPSDNTMGNGLKYFAKDTGTPQPFEAPPWAIQFPACESIGPNRHPVLPKGIEIGQQWMIELGGLRDTYADAEEIRDELLRLIYGLWDHTKNHCDRDSSHAENYRLVWVGHVAGKRENRRLMGDYVLTQNDIENQTVFPDRVAFGAWSIDDHYSGGFFHDGPPGPHFLKRDHFCQGVPFSIPFRCLYSKNVDNLMMAGRNISASHLALCDTRVMLTCAIIGHAVGIGSALCVESETTPRGVCENEIDRLQQQLLKEGATLFGLKNNDPRDLARQASASAPSERVHTSGERMVASNVINGLAKAIGERLHETTNAWAAEKDAASPHWIELTWPKPVSFNMVHVTFQTARTAPKWFAVEARQKDQWVTIAEVPQNRHRRHVLGLDRVTTNKLRVVLREPAAICEIRVYDEAQRLVEVARRAHHNMRLPDRGPWLPWGEETPSKKYDGIVVDASMAEQTGDWVDSTWSGPFVEDGYLHDGNTEKGEKNLAFHVELPKPGKYDVRLGYVAYGNRATNTPVTIHTADGPQTVRVNQREQPPIDGLFRSLGVYLLDTQTTIRINNEGTNGYVVVDALQFVAAD